MSVAETRSYGLQTIQYIQPQHYSKLGQAELLVVDEAAAIPLPIVKKMLGPYLVFLCSTVNGCAFSAPPVTVVWSADPLLVNTLFAHLHSDVACCTFCTTSSHFAFCPSSQLPRDAL